MDEFEAIETREINFRDYWRVLVKRRWLVIGFLLVVFTLTLLKSLTATPIYQSQCQILIEKTNPNIINPMEMLAADYTSAEFYQTQYKILESRTLAKSVIRRLHLTAHPEFVSPDNLQKQNQMISGNGAEAGGKKAKDNDLEEAVIGNFLGRLRVDPIRNSHLVNISFEAKDPALAARIANAMAAAYIDWNLGLRIKAQQDSSNFLDEQVKEQKQKTRDLGTGPPAVPGKIRDGGLESSRESEERPRAPGPRRCSRFPPSRWRPSRNGSKPRSAIARPWNWGKPPTRPNPSPKWSATL